MTEPEWTNYIFDNKRKLHDYHVDLIIITGKGHVFINYFDYRIKLNIFFNHAEHCPLKIHNKILGWEQYPNWVI